MATHSSTLAGKSYGRRGLVGCSPWGHKTWVTLLSFLFLSFFFLFYLFIFPFIFISWRLINWRLHFHFSLSFIGEGNDNPLQCSLLENPREGGACWAAVFGVTQSWAWLKQRSSSIYIWNRHTPWVLLDLIGPPWIKAYQLIKPWALAIVSLLFLFLTYVVTVSLYL